MIETLPRLGYRFLVEVEAIPLATTDPSTAPLFEVRIDTPQAHEEGSPPQIEPTPPSETEMEFILPLPKSIARALFLLIQAGYLAMYWVALYKMETLEHVVAAAGLPAVWVTLPLIMIMCNIAVRIYLASAVGWGHPAAGLKFHKIFPVLLVLDAIWAASPLLARGSIRLGILLAGVASLAYLPFAQRTLVNCLYPPKDTARTTSQHT